MVNEKIPCTVEVLTLNSGKTLEKCLQSLKDFAEIIILDGNSSDNTLEIANKFTDRIYPQKESNEKNIKITDFAEVRNRGLSLAAYDWFLFIDSDEFLSQESVEEIKEIVNRDQDNEYFIYNLPRAYIYENKILKKAKLTFQIRFFNKEAVLGFTKQVHERIQPKQGYRIGKLQNPEYVPLEDVSVLKEKWRRYLDIEMEKWQTISLGKLIIKTKANLTKFIKYFLKAIFSIFAGRRENIPFSHQLYNSFYHLQLIKRLFKVFLQKK